MLGELPRGHFRRGKLRMKARELLFQMQSRADGGGQLRVCGYEFSNYGCVPKIMDTSLPGILDINNNKN
jgi:hypothetical protein